MIIIGCPYPLEIGDIISNETSDKDNNTHVFQCHGTYPSEFCFKVMRIATREEYINQEEMQRYPEAMK